MRNKKIIFMIILIVLICISVGYTIIKKHKNEVQLNTNVNVIVDLDNSYVTDEDDTSEEETLVYAPTSEPVSFLTSEDLVNDFDSINENLVDNIDTTLEDSDIIDKIEFSLYLDENNFVDNFINLLSKNLIDYSIEELPITENLYDNLDNGIICQDTYNNGFIVLRIGLNTDNNTFMCLVRTVNQRTFFRGTLVNGKIDTITSTILK